MKYLVVLAFIAILASLASALFFMMRNGRDDKSKGNHMAKALAVRVGHTTFALRRREAALVGVSTTAPVGEVQA